MPLTLSNITNVAYINNEIRTVQTELASLRRELEILENEEYKIVPASVTVSTGEKQNIKITHSQDININGRIRGDAHFLEFDEKAVIKIEDDSGKTVFKLSSSSDDIQKFSDKITVPAGIYTIRVYTEGSHKIGGGTKAKGNITVEFKQTKVINKTAGTSKLVSNFSSLKQKNVNNTKKTREKIENTERYLNQLLARKKELMEQEGKQPEEQPTAEQTTLTADQPEEQPTAVAGIRSVGATTEVADQPELKKYLPIAVGVSAIGLVYFLSR